MATFEERIKDFLSNAYDIERELGGGGMSRVFVARDRLLGRNVVIKLLSPELTAEVNRGRFNREIQVAAQLQHPHIVTLLSAGESADLVYYTMPFIEGESLKSALEKNKRLAVEDVVRVLYDVVDALAYAHAHGVVHRDIKPANILRSGNHALVTDFGVAKALNASMPSTAMTSTGMAIGTPAYMAPEQLAGDPTADHRIDIYAVGLLAYELLSGESPFAASTAQGVLAAVLTRDPTPLSVVREDVPLKLSDIIMSCLSKMPGGRPPTAEALLDALDLIATSSGEIRTREHRVPSNQRTTPIPMAIPLSGAVPVTGPVTAATTQVPAEKGRKTLLLAGLAAVLLAATAAALFWPRGDSKSPSASVEPPKPVGAAAPAGNPVAAAPVMMTIDTAAIAESVRQRLAMAEAANKKGSAPINVDSIRRRVQREIADSIARANARRVAAAPSIVAPAPVAAAPAAAPAPAPAAPTSVTNAAPPPSGKKRLAITDPKPSDQPALNAFSRALVDAVRVSLDNGDAFDPVDQDSVRSAVARTKSRDEAAKILKPDVMLSLGYINAGDAVNVIVTVWDLRSNSSFGIRVTSSRLDPAHPENYLGPLVQSVMKQLDDLQRAPTIYRR
ncbi:MAG: serine/threonine-protein kinase [Gemmatimonadales bacterium]